MDKVATVDPNDLQKEALTAAAEARTLAALNDVRIHYLGRSSVLKLALRNVRDRETGMSLNTVRETVEAALTAREEELAQAELEGRLATERVDVTLPAALLGPPKLRPRGTLRKMSRPFPRSCAMQNAAPSGVVASTRPWFGSMGRRRKRGDGCGSLPPSQR